MNNVSRIGLIITVILMAPSIGAVEIDAAQKCNEIEDDLNLTIQYCTTAIKSGGLSTEELVSAMTSRGNAYYRKRNYDQAISDYSAVITLDPNIARIYIGRGMAYEYSERNYDETIDNFTSAIRLDPDNANYYNYRCWALVLKGDAESALSDCNKSLELRPDDSNTFDSRGIAHFALGDYQAALQDFNRTIQLDSEAWSTYVNRARVHEILDNPSQAEADRNIARENAQGEEQYESWLLNIEEAEKNNQSQDAISIPGGPYLGQKPPGSAPEPFAPGIVTTSGWEYGAVFAADMKEFYFLRNNAETDKHELVVFQNENNQWQQTGVSPRQGQPIIAPDGKTMHLGRRYKERTEAGWSDRKSLGAPFEDILIMRLSASSKGTYFFDQIVEDGEGGYDSAPIQSSQLVDGKYDDPKPLGKEINSGEQNSHPFIAPDESYIIWDSQRDEGFGDADIYISFKSQDGSWGTAINMGDKINTDAWEAAASVTPDGKYLFFNRNVGSDKYENVDIFWVDAQIIESLRPN